MYRFAKPAYLNSTGGSNPPPSAGTQTARHSPRMARVVMKLGESTLWRAHKVGKGNQGSEGSTPSASTNFASVTQSGQSNRLLTG